MAYESSTRSGVPLGSDVEYQSKPRGPDTTVSLYFIFLVWATYKRSE